jgi:hypothetical protein
MESLSLVQCFSVIDKELVMINSNLKELVSFHHFGLAVRKFTPALIFYENMGYECSKPIIDPLQSVEIVMCMSNYMPWIEIIKPLGNDSPINNYLKHYNENIYHICYKVDKLKEILSYLKKFNRVVCVKNREPAKLFNNKLVSFYYIKDVGLFEFLEDF